MKNLENLTFKDFENIPGKDFQETAALFNEHLERLNSKGHLNYRIPISSACGPEMDIKVPGKSAIERYVCFVSNDYLGFTQHPAIKEAVIKGITEYGVGAGATPLIGGLFDYHEQLEKKIAAFFKKEAAIGYTTGYTANSATLQCILKKEDIAIVDMAAHASVYEGCLLTNVKTFLHNNLEMLEQILKNSQDKFRTKMVIVDGVYSQDGDLPPLKEIAALTKQYGAYLMVDEAHGAGVVGKNGRGSMEQDNLFDQVDIVTGSFSKALGSVGGYVTGDAKLISFLNYQSRQHAFSTTATPATIGILKALDLVDEEPERREKLWQNINYLKKGLLDQGFNIGTTNSSIIPVKIGDISKTLEASRLLLDMGIYSNPIMYPAVAKKNSRLRLNIMTTHTVEHLDKLLNALGDVDKKLHISNKYSAED